MKQQRAIRATLIVGSALFGLIAVVLFLSILLSPYGNPGVGDYKLVKESVVIKAPVSQVYQYLGNSENARQWSTYLHHITPLNDQKIPDGKVGSIRRCFVYQNEKGQRWDEEVLSVSPNHHRQISCYNFIDFEVSAGLLNTEQLYEETVDGHCLLSFTLFLSPEESPSWIKYLKMYFGSYIVARVFQKNLENIKRLNEEVDTINRTAHTY